MDRRASIVSAVFFRLCLGGLSATVAAGMACAGAAIANAQSLPTSMAQAYQVSPQLNAARAQQRATDEVVPQALAGYRPQIIGSLSAGLAAVRNLLPDNTIETATLRPWTIGVTVTQNLFNGFKTANSVRVAEAQVMSGRETLRNTGQGVLLDAVTAYMNVLANQTLVESQRLALQFYTETLAVTQRRLAAGDVTPTDTAQAQARLARAKADLNAAEVQLAVSQALFEQVIGSPPGKLEAAQPIDRLLPHSREQAIEISSKEHPVILGAMFDVDVAEWTIHVAESSLFPQLNAVGNVSRNVQTDTTLGTTRTDQASIVGQLNVPIYDGGLAASQTRQAKETATQSRLVLEQVRNQTRTAVVSAWVTSEGAKIALAASEAEVSAATLALQGVQREAQGGQRTTVDVLNAQGDLMSARARLIGAQRDRIIASYTLLSAIGHLDVKTLNLNTPDYMPEAHYHQVRDAWGGLRTPSGR